MPCSASAPAVLTGACSPPLPGLVPPAPALASWKCSQREASVLSFAQIFTQDTTDILNFRPPLPPAGLTGGKGQPCSGSILLGWQLRFGQHQPRLSSASCPVFTLSSQLPNSPRAPNVLTPSRFPDRPLQHQLPGYAPASTLLPLHTPCTPRSGMQPPPQRRVCGRSEPPVYCRADSSGFQPAAPSLLPSGAGRWRAPSSPSNASQAGCGHEHKTRQF